MEQGNPLLNGNGKEGWGKENWKKKIPPCRCGFEPHFRRLEPQKNPAFAGFFECLMVQPAGLEPATSSFAGKRSNPTELWLRGGYERGRP